MSIEQLFRRHYRPLCLYAAHYLDDIDTAEDVVMDCFVRFAEKVDNGEEPVSPKSYLYGMTRNACIDHARRNPIRNAAASDVELEAMTCDDSELQERSEREARLWTEIDSLPTMCRTVFLMSKRDGKRNSDIAATLGISIKTVEAHMHKALATLRRQAKAIYLLMLQL